MGFPTTLSMAAGALVGWGALGPLAHHRGWAPGPTGDMSTGARGWILWVALAIMCADSLVSLVPVAAEFVTSRLARREADTAVLQPADEEESELPERLVPTAWVTWGLGASVAFGTVVIWAVFGEKPWATLCGFLAGSLLSILGYVLF
jgi:uncharacterized oligopeptide transporter (OPT) family protein